MMGYLDELKSNASDPVWWNRLIRRRLVGQFYYGLLPNRGHYVMEEDWDLLIILDGCRYDLFSETIAEFDESLLPHLESRVSRGAATRQFIKENFSGREYFDTVYVSANPWVELDVRESFHATVPIWETEWDEHELTVLPESVYTHTLEVASKYPRKRIIAHFMQPHYPFIGSDLTDDTQAWDADLDGGSENPRRKSVSVWNLLERGDLQREDVWAAYRQNLLEVLPYADRLAREVAGRSVITSDHGNGAGEFCWPFPVRAYGHPRNIRINSIVEVPWLVYGSDTRRDVVSESSTRRKKQVEEDVVTERLEHLGYTS